jgi:peptidyl-prolyl cis-trans isomerase SurA
MKLLFWCCVMGWLPLALVQAASADRIVAVVNEEIITQSELNARSALAARALGLEARNPRQQAALQRRTLAEMVDEKLQFQYAQMQGLQPTTAEIRKAKDETMAHMGAEAWAAFTHGIAPAAEDKLRAEATWARLMQTVIAPRVQLGNAEIDKLIEEMSKTQTLPEKSLSLIFIPLTEPTAQVSATQAEVIPPADAATRVAQLRAELTAPGADAAAFAAAAKANSAAPSAAQGGALGWLTAAEIPQGIEAAIQGLGVGEISQPLRTPEGWLLVRVNEIRTRDATAIRAQPVTEYQLYLLAAERPSSTEVVEALSATLQQATAEHATSAAVADWFASQAPAEKFNRSTALGWVPAAALQPEVGAAVKATKIGAWTSLLTTPAQLSRLFVAASRQAMPPEVLALRERVAQNLRANRTELEARRFMRELRQRAFVDIRL